MIDRLDVDLGVVGKFSWRSGKPLIIIYGDEQQKFTDGIKPFIPWECFQYKCRNRERLAPNGEASRLHGIERGKRNLASALRNRGWELLSEYTDREMQFRCEHGKVFTRIRASVMQPDALCDCIPLGSKNLEKGKQKLMNLLSSKSWELVSDYSGIMNYHALRCQHGREFKRWLVNIQSDSKCDCERYTSTSGERGVYLEKSGRWKAVVSVGKGNRISLGTFQTKEAATLARQEYLLKQEGV